MPYPVGPAAVQSMMVSTSKDKDKSPDKDDKSKCITKAEVLRICKRRFGPNGATVFVNLYQYPEFEPGTNNPTSVVSLLLKLLNGR